MLKRLKKRVNLFGHRDRKRSACSLAACGVTALAISAIAPAPADASLQREAISIAGATDQFGLSLPHADHVQDFVQNLAQSHNGQRVPFSVVLSRIRAQYAGNGGKVIGQSASGDRYYFRVLTRDGRRLDITVDARTGQTVSVRGG